MRLFTLLLLTALTCAVPCFAQEPASAPEKGSSSLPTAAVTADGPVVKALVLLQSEIGGKIKNGNAVVVSSGESSKILSSYEAVKGAATIHAYVPGEGLVPAHLLKFAPDANLALMEIPVSKLPVAPIGDAETIKANDKIEMTSAIAIKEGRMASGMNPLTRLGAVQNVIPRPTGALLRLSFIPGVPDESTGAPVVSPNTGSLIAIALSLESAQVDSLRFAVPINLASALDNSLVTSADSVASIKVLDGSQAPVLRGDPDADEGEDSDIMGYVVTIVVSLVILGTVAFFVFRKKNKVVPFSILPRLPDGVNFAFVDENGRLLPMDSEIIKVGRADDNDWRFIDSTVSNYHAIIKKGRTNSTFIVEDKHSSNGTFVRGRKIGGAETVDAGNIVRFGKSVQVMLISRQHSNF